MKKSYKGRIRREEKEEKKVKNTDIKEELFLGPRRRNKEGRKENKRIRKG